MRSLSPLRSPLAVSVLLFGCSCLLLLYACTSPPGGTEPAKAAPYQVVGTLAVTAQSPITDTLLEIELPGAAVFLQPPGSGNPVAETRTRLDGKFHLFAPSPGTYEICWKVQELEGCSRRVVVDGSTDVYLETVSVEPDGAILSGEVLTADGRACWVQDPFFALDVTTTVDVTRADGQQIRQGILANGSGEYAVLGLEPGRYELRARCEAAETQQTVSVGSTHSAADLTLPNRAPRIVAVAGFDDGEGTTRAEPGTELLVQPTLRDPDEDSVEVLWRLLDGSGTLAPAAGDARSWELPSRPGLYTLYAMARDGRGGYAYERLTLQVGDPSVRFSGRVIDEVTLAPVAGAQVEVNGSQNETSAQTTTNAQGWFDLRIEPVPSERYVLNVRHGDYALLSRIHDRSALGNTYSLIRAQVRSVDPTAPIDLVDSDSSGPCGSPAGEGQDDPTVLTTPVRPTDRYGEPLGDDLRDEPCRHRGARLVIPAGGLVDTQGQPPQGPVTAAMATLNPERRSIPGDYQAFDRDGERAELLSFGAVYVEFEDANGTPLDLAPDATAEVRVPVSERQSSVAQPQIALWSYDESTGFWVEEGTAELQDTPQGPMYVGETTHFSTINMDVAGNDPANATCVRLELDSSLSAWQNLVLRAFVTYGGDSSQVKETALDGDQYHAIYRIPYGNSFPPNTLRLELRGTFSGQEVVLLDDIINTDARPKMTGDNLWPEYPYTECGDPILLEADPIALPDYGDIEVDGADRPAFLTGPYGQFLPSDGEQVATDYYNAIDPAGDKDTLGKWWVQNGFGNDGSGGTRAAYLNHNDLGFGRDMHCLESGDDLACYVTNYGLPNQNPANADAADTQDPAQRGATVTMEYDASAPDAERVQFYVFGGGEATAGRIKFADLDGLGPKTVPHLCLVCHGGTFNDTTKKAEQSRFREFDLPSFKYSGGRDWDFGDTTLTNPELTSFADLNRMVRDIAPTPSPIRSVIDEWYPGGFGANTAPVEPQPPAGWSGTADDVTGYHEVYATSCRTCHVARDAGNPDNFYTFNSVDDFSVTASAVCVEPRVMPNAFVTYKNFWSDPNRVLLYEGLTGVASGTCQD